MESKVGFGSLLGFRAIFPVGRFGVDKIFLYNATSFCFD